MAFGCAFAASGYIIVIPISVSEAGGQGCRAFGVFAQSSDGLVKLAEPLDGLGADGAAIQTDLNSRDLLIEQQGLLVRPGDVRVVEFVKKLQTLDRLL